MLSFYDLFIFLHTDISCKIDTLIWVQKHVDYNEKSIIFTSSVSSLSRIVVAVHWMYCALGNNTTISE